MAGKLPKRTIMGGSPTPRKTGKGRKGMGLGYHGHPGNATTPAKGLGYHGKPPKNLVPTRRSRRPVTSPGGNPPMVHPVAKPAGHKAGTRRAPGHNIGMSKSK